MVGALLVLGACSSTTGTVGSTDPNGAPSDTAGADAAQAQSDAGGTADGAAANDGGAVPESDASDDASVVADAGVDPADAGADAAADAAVDANGTAQCADVTQLATPTVMVDRVASFSSADLAGGALPDGTYVLTTTTHYVEPSHVDGVTRPYGRETLTVHGGVLEDVFEYPAGDVVAFEATVVANGNRLQMTPRCVRSSSPGAHNPELGDWAPLVHEVTAFETTPTTFTIWTPRGNHESIVRVYVKAGAT